MGFQNSFKALSSPVRREILNILKDGEKNAGQLSEKFNMTDATISHHLSILKQADLVRDEKRGKYIYYELNMSVIQEIFLYFKDFEKIGEDEETDNKAK